MSNIKWLEDELYGRYEVTLVVDTGSTDGALEIAAKLREVAAELGLGYNLRTTTIIGLESKRRPS